MHTSTVTVAVLPEPPPGTYPLRDDDLAWETTKGSGPGGQHRQKNETAVVVKHIPTGLVVRAQSERSQHRNRESALAILRARLDAQHREQIGGDRNAVRREHVGSGMRGDKVRTIRCQDGIVTDHASGQRWRLKDYLRGEW